MRDHNADFFDFAIYFVIWWMTLFAVLPIGLRTQAEDNDVILGTVESAPTKFRGWRVFLMTTLVSAVIYGAWYVARTISALASTRFRRSSRAMTADASEIFRYFRTKSYATE